MTRLRRTIAARLKEAQNTAAMLTTFNEVDMTRGHGAASRIPATRSRRSTRASASASWAFFVRACCAALKEFPAVNAEIDGDDIVYKNFVHMGDRGRRPIGPGGAGDPRRRPAGLRRDREPPSPNSADGPRRPAQAGRPDRRHVQHHQRRRLRLADVDADPEPAPVRHPGDAQDPGAARWWSAARSRSGQ